MKKIIPLFALVQISIAQTNPAPVADFAFYLGQDVAAAAPLKLVKSKSGVCLAHTKGELDWFFTIKDGKIVQATVSEMPRWPDSLTQAAEAFGFRKDKGWVIGQPFRRGVLECVFLTHKDQGVLLLKATPGNNPAKFSVLNFFAPGHQ